MPKTQNWIEAGLFLRGDIRRGLLKAGIKFSEDKGWTSSLFIVPNDEEYRRVVRVLKKNGYLT